MNNSKLLVSEEAALCDECRQAGFSLDKNGVIRDPGKFGGEPLSTYHSWHLLMDGFADEFVDDRGFIFAWRTGNVICQETSSGFVYGAVFASEAEAAEAFAEEYGDDDDEEYDED